MSHVVIIGCGIVGATIAYELSQVPGLTVTVLDKQPPAQGATGAALGVLMGVISHKTKGKAWQMRQASIQRYETLIPELEALTGRQIPFNSQGILMLLPREPSSAQQHEDNRSHSELQTPNSELRTPMADWEKLVEIRRSQGWQLEIWNTDQIETRCPQLNCERIRAAVYSPQDRQVEPVALTLALVEAAQHCGATFHFGVTVEGYDIDPTSDEQHLCRKIHTASTEAIQASGLPDDDVDWLVVAAGLGSSSIGAIQASSQLDLRPVLGQALHLRLKHPIGNPDFQPVMTGDDVHIVPVGKGEYWVGATVEFPSHGTEILPDSARLEAVMEQAIAFCPALAEATVVKTWSGLRPRPEGRPAPVIGQLPGYSNILLATGHYRNGVLLAPATAQAIRRMILDFRF